MEVKLMTDEDLRNLINKIDNLEKKIDNLSNKPKLDEIWLDNQEEMELLKIRPRTLQNYRDKGVIPFSQMGSKIYYKACDIQKHLDNHYRPAFKNNKSAAYVK